ncbi:MAG: TonB-dependent receptor plug domain-containing protein, partial [Alphaproteobacteria bacterium]|nr:TonB-dependent receptor plug domain-containing protein [Alphaproteobacteria bacterium]
MREMGQGLSNKYETAFSKQGVQTSYSLKGSLSSSVPCLRRQPMTKSTGRYLSVTSTMLSLFLLLSTGILHPVQADEYRTAQFDIVSQPLGSALVTYSEQANVQVVVAANAVTDLYSNQVAGRMDISSALSEMLRKTDLNHEFSGDTVAITAETAGAAKQSQQPQQREERRAAPPQRRPGDQSQGPGDGALALEEIVVTAEKRAVSLQRTAISLTAFTDERITQSAIEDIYDIGLLTPGVIVNKEIVGKIYIRGIGTENLTIGGDPGVAVHVDGAYVARTSAANFELFDTERVEVLRGPQGTLYGRNATGGSINIISKAPTDEPYARGEVQYGDYDRFRIGATANAPLSDKVYARANVVYSRRDGFTPNLFTGQDLDTEDLLMGRLRLRFLPSDNVTIDLIGDFAVDDSRPAPFKQLEFSELFEGLNGAFDPPGLREVSQDSPVVESQDQFGLTGIVTWDFADTTLTSISSFRDIEFFAAFDGDATDILFQNFADTSNSRQFTQELQLASATDDRLSWLAGLYYFNDSGDTTIFIPIPGFGFDILHEATISTDAFAAFGQATYDVSDRFSATLGLCYSVEGKDAFQFTDFGFIPPIEQPLEENSDAITPRFALEFTPNEETLMYASVTRGFKSGGFTFNGFQGNFEPEFVWAYEAGYKTRFADDRVQANLSGFY